jgi:hypothetical protein
LSQNDNLKNKILDSKTLYTATDSESLEEQNEIDRAWLRDEVEPEKTQEATVLSIEQCLATNFTEDELEE